MNVKDMKVNFIVKDLVGRPGNILVLLPLLYLICKFFMHLIDAFFGPYAQESQ